MQGDPSYSSYLRAMLLSTSYAGATIHTQFLDLLKAAIRRSHRLIPNMESSILNIFTIFELIFVNLKCLPILG